MAPINTNLDNVPGVAYYLNTSQYYDPNLANNGLDVSFEGLPRPEPPHPDDDGGNTDAHVVDPEAGGFEKFVEHHKAFFITGLIIFILIVGILGVAFYVYDRKKRKGIYKKINRKSQRA